MPSLLKRTLQIPRRPGFTRQRCPQAKQRTAWSGSRSISSPSRTRASSAWARVAAPPSGEEGASWLRNEMMLRCVMGSGAAAFPQYSSTPTGSAADPKRAWREVVEERGRADVAGGEITHLGLGVHDVARIRRAVEAE